MGHGAWGFKEGEREKGKAENLSGGFLRSDFFKTGKREKKELLPMPIAQCPLPNAHCPMPIKQLPIARFNVYFSLTE
ncbi:hypothetical protein [Tolypothrix sp. VBCCA 56010]|uniref:hypothetical protein n=1 Tax=Tolypothrix sp. VBCCA 56010 TaxID=3137731 RepID=UPI003D7E08D2